ncbi:hypothetical protein BKA70DRAFT_257537 [Coprinopsis sp. MPI-PUGE-AT-0042]|nr:hypothetical protein BKA70DRAFT_351443 [Coprinopsis sp. MPI-PUGE-AT-0042]KAH6874500.1 hypothetical protein BKA70DRAFT_257537 [Coprinopsis sp. MPI-PUGE-AT-0042]
MMMGELAEAGLTDADVQVQVIWLVAFWLQGILYGVYLGLFILAFPVLIWSNALKNFSATVFLVGNMLIFVLVSINSSVSLFRVIVAFAQQSDIKGPLRILGNMNYWATYLPLVFGVIVFMIGDILMIYRCFLVWRRNYWAILLPIILAALSAGFHMATVWFARQVTFNFFLFRIWPPTVLPPIFYFLQTALTTSLITWKIWSVSRRNAHVGLVSVNVPRLLSIVCIMAESAAIFTAGMLAMVVLIALDHPAKEVVHACMLPITGIVFVLMALRIHAVRVESKEIPASPSLMPTWLFDEPKVADSGIETVEQSKDQRPTESQTPPLAIPTDLSPSDDVANQPQVLERHP